MRAYRNKNQVRQHVFEHCYRQLCNPATRRVGQPAMVSWSHLGLAIMLCFVRG
ncbi:MAG TPA: hypothetical protein VGF67_05420 [Ktedonobacteraceae bacterium]